MFVRQSEISLAIAISIVSYPLYPISVNTPSGFLISQNTPDIPSTPPPRGNRKIGGGLGSGDSCKETNKPLTALAPLQIERRLTASEYPTFWFYIPYAGEEIQPVEFSLHDRDEEEIYRTTLNLSKTPGIIGIRLPYSPKYALKEGKFYHWYLVIKCQENSQSSLSVNEWVQRVPLTPQVRDRIDTANPNVWYDSLTRIAELRRTASQDEKLKNEWTTLLKSGDLQGLPDLQKIAEEPLVESIQLEEKVSN